MKIEEKFYTISENELKQLCKNVSRSQTKQFEENQFIISYQDNICYLENNKRISSLTFSVNVNEIKPLSHQPNSPQSSLTYPDNTSLTS